MKAFERFITDCILAEGCIWNDSDNCLYFVDIEGKKMFKADLQNDTLEEYDTSDKTGCIVLGCDKGIITAEKNCLIYRDEINSTDYKKLLHQDFSKHLRYNDGKCDSHGNLWIGTMAISQTHKKANRCGGLYCIKENSVMRSFDGYTIPNGMAWSANGAYFYHIDTALQCVDVHEVVDEIDLVNRKILFSIPQKDGSPDGMCIDEEGNLWIAHWGGGKVCGYDLNGNKIEEIMVPNSLVTCCCFGGENNKDLFITTAKDEKGEGGHVFQCRMHVAGGKVYKYNGGKL